MRVRDIKGFVTANKNIIARTLITIGEEGVLLKLLQHDMQSHWCMELQKKNIFIVSSSVMLLVLPTP